MKTQSNSLEKGKTKVIILAGFLGAGKTTLLQRIFSWESNLSDTVVIVNEFGDIGIDGSLLENAGSEVVELTSGCVCCTLKVDLNLTLRKIWKEYNPRCIFIEATGVADPIAIMEVFDAPELYEHMEVYKVITVLDADCWEMRECFGSVFFNQLRKADLILLNKIDTIEQEKISDFLREIHALIPNSRIVPTIHCDVDPGTLWIEGHSKGSEAKLDQFFHVGSSSNTHQDACSHNRGSGDEKFHYISFSFTATEPLDEKRFKQFVSGLPWEVFRMKGPVRFQDRTMLVNSVGGQCEWADWSGREETRLVFVGWNVNAKETMNKLRNCIAKS